MEVLGVEEAAMAGTGVVMAETEEAMEAEGVALVGAVTGEVLEVGVAALGVEEEVALVEEEAGGEVKKEEPGKTHSFTVH